MSSTMMPSKNPTLAKLSCVLVMDPNPNGARFLVEIFKGLGVRSVIPLTRTSDSLEPMQRYHPDLIVTEIKGEDFDGFSTVRALRRSALPLRAVPVVVVSAEATVETIRGARDSGAHEFLRKPFSLRDMEKRLEVVLTKPRAWVATSVYTGPDRRRFNSKDYAGPRKRRVDAA